ncbi:hypothetical protein EON83_12975 [bacterium]|nr:MAG: hypothetical protein EON83_12975 [bacterium]
MQFGQGLNIANNTITGNGGDGVTVLSGSTNTITTNAIYSNKLLGIDLKGDGVTLNSATGATNTALPNLGQNFPELLSAQVVGGTTTVAGLLKGAAKATYRIEFFVSAARDSSGYGEGQKFISATNITTDTKGTAKLSATLSVVLSGTQFLSMTATDAKGNTSEFSGISRAITGQVYTTITDPKNAKATIKQGLVNVRIERLDSKGVVKEVTGTDSDGNYLFIGVPDGTWTVKPSSKTGTFDTQFAPATRGVAVSASKPTVSGVDFTTYSISGTVKDLGGKALANQLVILSELNRSVKTGRDGNYRFEGLGKAAFTIIFGDTFSPKSSLVTLPTTGVAGVSPNARVDAQQGLSLSGRVTDVSGTPLVNVRIDLLGSNISPVVTDKNGMYQFDGLPAGAYRVAPTASAGKFNPSSCNVTLKDKNVSGMDFAKLAASPAPRGFSGGDS